MDGRTAIRTLRELLNMSTTSDFLNPRTSYDYLDRAVLEFVSRTDCLKTSQTITVAASQSSYYLNADFLKLYLTNEEREYVIKYSIGTDIYFPVQTRESEIIFTHKAAQLVPDTFTIRIKPSLEAAKAGAATQNGDASGHLASLVDGGADFGGGTGEMGVASRDMIHNKTDGGSGLVISKVSDTELTTAMFEGRPDGGWTEGDEYTVQCLPRKELVIDPSPTTASHVITVHYTQMPPPVYHDYGVYMIEPQFMNGIVAYAAFLYKYRDREPDFGDTYFKMFKAEVSRANEIYTNNQKTQYWQQRVE
jgi:hypothetical protein